MTPGNESVWNRVEQVLVQLAEGIRVLPVTPAADGWAQVRALRQQYPLDEPVPLGKLVDDVARLLREGTVHVTHPRYFGLFNPSVREAGVIADTLTAAFNPQLAVWAHAPVALELERLTLARLARTLGLDPNGVASNFTTGGTEANLSAVLAALARLTPDWCIGGFAALHRRPALYVSVEGHHSFARTAGSGSRKRPCKIPDSTAGFAATKERTSRDGA